MPGFFGSDFDQTEPADSGLVKTGAAWIRDVKGRLKRFLSVLFNLETGEFKEGVLAQAWMRDLSPDPSGTWTSVTVNDKGLVTAGTNPVEQQTAGVFRAIYTATGAVIDNSSTGEVDAVAAPAGLSYPGVDPFGGRAFAVTGTTYFQYVFTIPTGTRRVKAFIVGAGGGGVDAGDNEGGASGEYIETVFDVEGKTSLTVIVGQGGGDGAAGVDGAPSSVILSSTIYADAGPGGGGASGTPGSPVAGHVATDYLSAIQFAGAAGDDGVGGVVPGPLTAYGNGSDGSGGGGGNGVVILEWLE